MYSSSFLSCLRLPTILLIAGLTTACSNYHYKDYQGDWAPELMRPYDLSNNAVDAPVVYFATIRYRGLGVKFHRLLLATHVDDQLLEGAGRRSILDISGKQALRLTPGKHSLRWCWVSMNALGTGGGKCDFGVRDLEFQAGQRYIVDFSTFDGMSQITINSEIRNMETHEVIFPLKKPAEIAKQ
ncbi:hypothetical protein [Pseudomonas huaxiensis]|uniref:hypothetical protein n=1 Tax=Pseudomonas huaxiensis TaxID=2213017 RepID=UPI000DA64E45|nr:hypothetical protein [Pseudomonas huaxiensis]